MTVKELKSIINSIPSREDDRNVAFAGSLLKEHDDSFSEVEFTWIDCSDAMLVLLNEAV